MVGAKRLVRVAPMAVIAALALGLVACDGAERMNESAKDDVRGMGDFLGSRGITVNTMLPER